MHLPPDVGEVTRRLDWLTGDWGADFVRLNLEWNDSYEAWMVQYQSVLDDPQYLADIVQIVQHAGGDPGAVVLVSPWTEPSFNSHGWPTAETGEIWEALAEALVDEPNVMFGLAFGPTDNDDGSLDPQAWEAMNDVAQVIRDVEESHGAPQHVIVAPGTGGSGLRLDYYVDHPLTAGGGTNFAYEIHLSAHADVFGDLITVPGQTLPVIIGSFSPDNWMTEGDCDDLVDLAEEQQIPYLAAAFHMRCWSEMIVDHSAEQCGVGMVLETTDWGEHFRSRLSP